MSGKHTTPSTAPAALTDGSVFSLLGGVRPFEDPLHGIGLGFKELGAAKRVEPSFAGYETAPNTLAQALITNPHLALLLADKPVVFHSFYLKLLGDTREAVRNAYVLSKLVELDLELDGLNQGWFTLDMAGWNNLLGLSYGHQLAARKALMGQGLLIQSMQGYPAVAHYKVDTEVLMAKLVELGEALRQEQQVAAAKAAASKH